ncbi:MAG: DUF2341 domain-containing protein [Verrucomicrobia bacterium]|nr:DUF2341 domain-containing protein [Verrucomicrobiota bacterium]
MTTNPPLRNGLIARLLVVTVLASAGSATAINVINVNYAGNPSVAMQGTWSYDPAARGTASRVAPMEYLGNTWNDLNTATATASKLLDSVGTPTAVGLATTMEGGFWADWNGLGGARLLKSPVAASYQDFKPAFTLSGLNPGHTYDLYIASLHNNNNNPQDFRVGAVEKHVANGGRNLDWTEGQNYLRLAGLKPDGGGNLTVEGKGQQLIVNGFQLVDNEAPTPKSPDKSVFSFSFGELGTGKISGTDITLDVLWGTAVNKLAPACKIAERATVKPASGSVNNFTKPVSYTVTAEDGSATVYRVAVTILPKSSAKEITACNCGVFGAAAIVGETIHLAVPASQPLKTLAPTFTISPFATLRPASGSANDFTRPLNYTVTAQDGSTKVYQVTARAYSAWAHAASLAILTTPEAADLPATAAVTDFPILLRLNAGNFDFAQAKPQGEDLRFSTTAGTRLFYQIEQWDAGSATASIWVKIPLIKGNAVQQIRMYWGLAEAAGESNGPAVFNATNGYASVLHMDEALTDEGGLVVPKNEGATTVVGGMIGKGRHFVPGKGIPCGDHIKTYPYSDQPFTSQLWFRAELAGATLLSWGRYATRYNGFTGDGNLVDTQLRSPAGLGWASDGPGGVAGKTIPLMGQWYQVAATYADGTSKIYVNGLLDGSNEAKQATMSLMNDIYMNIGKDNFAGDIDEVRVSKVARSADWIKLEYENQKAGQTLVGTLMQPGDEFAVSPAEIKLGEGQKVTVTAKAGGALKLYWTIRKDGRETISAVDQFAYQLDAGRVVGDASYVLQLKAVFPNGVKTREIPVTIKEDLPEPVVTLKAPAQWNGRDPIEIVPVLTNLKAMTDKKAGDLHYQWTVAGGAVIKLIAPGKLILTRSQYTGPLAVTAAIHNGGTATIATTTIQVTEPKGDPWVQRTPGKEEQPVDNQFYARDDLNEGTLNYNGALDKPADSVFLKLYADDKLIKTAAQKPAADKSYAFAVKLKPGLIKYKVEFGTKTGTTETVVRTVNHIICGDAYLLNGQSNTVADNKGGKHGLFKSEWIRSFGGMGGDTNCGWGNAVASSADGDAYRIGYWGVALADRLVTAHQIPICMLNGAVGGTRIDQHQRNDSKPEDPDTIYGRLLARVKAAKLTHGIRGVLWHQGENNSGAAAPTGDWDYQSYQQYFVELSAGWKQDYPNIRHYYVYQVWPLPCSMGPKGAGVREAQRTLPRLYSNMSVMSTIGIKNSFNGRGLCHFDWDGYEQFATLMGPLVERDNYGLVPPQPITAPDLQKAWFTTPRQNEIALEFGQDMAFDPLNAINLYLDGAKGQVTGGSVSGKVIKLKLAGPSKAKTIDYVADNDWDGSRETLLLGANGIAALTFCEVPIVRGK